MIKGVKHHEEIKKSYMGDYIFVPLTSKFDKESMNLLEI